MVSEMRQYAPPGVNPKYLPGEPDFSGGNVLDKTMKESLSGGPKIESLKQREI